MVDLGLVTKVEANFYTVVLGPETYLCSMRANLKKAGVTIRVGDKVTLDSLEEERPVIDRVQERDNELQKPAVANIDQVLLVMSCLQPDFNPILLDRLILAVEYQHLKPVICVSKADLMDEELEEWLTEEYGGFPLIFFSVNTERGMQKLYQQIAGKISVLAGPSGVGKSSLVNALNPACELVVGEVNQKLGTGKHTTRHVSLHAVETGKAVGWLADSPGFSACEIPPIDPQELSLYYPEFLPWLGQCAFADCLHRDDEDLCAVMEHVDTDSERYYNYLRLLAEVEEKYRERQSMSSKAEGLTKKAVGKNKHEQVLKLGTLGRAVSRRTQNQEIEQLVHQAELDPESLEDY